MSYLNIAWDTSTNRDLLKAGLRKVFNNTARKALYEAGILCNEEKGNDYWFRDARIAGFYNHQPVSDGQDIPLENPKFGGVKTWTQSRYGLGFRITAGMKKFNRYDLMKTFTSDLSKTMVESKDREIANMWNNMTATTYASGYDSLAIASNSHTCLDDLSTTYDNYGDAALGFTSLQTGLLYYHALKDDQGNTFTAVPNLLVVGKDNLPMARELVGSTGKPHEQSNTLNFIRDEYNLKVRVYHRWTATTPWVLAARNESNYGFFVHTTQAPTLHIVDSPDQTLDSLVLADQWFTYGVRDPRMLYVGDT